jgi:hypothetical protein
LGWRRRRLLSLLFFGFDCRRFLGILFAQLYQLYLRFGVAYVLGVPTAFVGLVSQIDRASGHVAAREGKWLIAGSFHFEWTNLQ